LVKAFATDEGKIAVKLRFNTANSGGGVNPARPATGDAIP